MSSFFFCEGIVWEHKNFLNERGYDKEIMKEEKVILIKQKHFPNKIKTS